MIRINLLIKPKPTNWRRVAIMTAGAIVAVAFGAYLAFWWMSYSRLRTELKALKDLTADYQAKLGQETDLKAREEKAAKQRAAVNGLSRHQGADGQSVVLQAILAAVPSDVDVTSISFRGDGGVEISGRTGRFQSAFAFRDKLRSMSDLLTSVTDKSVSTAANGETTFAFTAMRRVAK